MVSAHPFTDNRGSQGSGKSAPSVKDINTKQLEEKSVTKSQRNSSRLQVERINTNLKTEDEEHFEFCNVDSDAEMKGADHVNQIPNSQVIRTNNPANILEGELRPVSQSSVPFDNA